MVPLFLNFKFTSRAGRVTDAIIMVYLAYQYLAGSVNRLAAIFGKLGYFKF